MVRVFSAYQFAGQSIQCISGDVRAACIIDAKHLILAKSNHVIEIVTLLESDISDGTTDAVTASNENEIETKFTFPAVDEVKQMVYCKFGNYLATIERKSTNSGDQSYCRIYTNWPSTDSFSSDGSKRTPSTSSSSENSVNVTIRARIAGKVTPSSAHANCLEVIEIPISKIVGHNASANYYNDGDDFESTSSSAGCASNSTRNTMHPVNYYPHQIASCQETGTLICAIHRCIKLYKFIECTKDNTHFKYIDFVELPFEIDLEFVPMHFTINENWIAASNSQFVCVFKLLERSFCNAADSDDMMSANSLTTSSELSGANVFANGMPTGDRLNGDSFAEMNDGSGTSMNHCSDDDGQVFDYKNASRKYLSSITSIISSNYDQMTTDPFGRKSKFDKNRGSSEFRPLFIENSVPLCSLRHLTPACAEIASDEFYKDYVVKALLQIKQHDAVTDPFQSLVIQPIYMNSIVHAGGSDGGKDCSDALDASNNIFRSVESRKFVGISILLATINDGYLYQFSNNEKWTMSEDELQNSCLIATYPFTSPIVDVRITDYVIHALTDHGIETYTHRIGHKLFSCSYEYNLRDDLFAIEACPRVEEPICLIGLRPFLGIQKMLSTDQNLILLASSTSKTMPNKPGRDKLKHRNDTPTTNWTIYNLKMAQADELYHDFIELANSYIGNSPKLYAHLLSEAHMILRIAKEISFHSNASIASTGGNHRTSIEYMDCINKLFLESCLHLADICVMSPHREEYCLAFPYYAMSQTSINEIFDRIVRLLNENDNERSTTGAIHTLKAMIIKSTESAESIGHRLTAAHTTSGNNNQTFGDKLLDFFAVHAPNEISIIGLNSVTFRELMSAKLCDVILRTKSDGKLSNEDKLCIILESIRSNQRARINELLLSFTAADLYHLLITHWPILFETTRVKKTGKFVTTFSEFMESYLLPTVSGSQAFCVAEVLKNLLHTQIIGIELVLKLFMNYLAAHFGQAHAYLSAQSMLECILEAYFHHLYVVRGYADSLSSASDACAKGGFRNDECHLNGYGGGAKSGGNRNQNQNNNNNIHDSLCSHTSGDSDRTSSSAATNMSDNSLDQMTTKRSEANAMAHDAMGHAVHSDALKILIRIYLGALKMSTDPEKSAGTRVATVTGNAIQLKYIKFMRENFNKIYSNHVLHATQLDTKATPITPRVDDNHAFGGHRSLRPSEVKRMQASFYSDANQGIKLQKTPILFLSRRPNYLNGMRPIGEDEQLKATLESKMFSSGDILCADDERRKATIIVLKLQSLLASGKLTRDILQEIIQFIEANTPFVGVDSFLTLLMPFDLCVDYLIELCPEHLLEYAKNCITDDQRWQQLLLRITMQRKRIIQNRSQTFYENLLKEHLDYLVHTKRLSEILNTIFPIKYIGETIDRDNGGDGECNDGTLNDPNGGVADKLKALTLLNGVDGDAARRPNDPMKNSDYEIFTQYLKTAIDLDRSERLSEMIKTTGLQLYNTIAGNNLNADNIGATNANSN